MRRVLIMAGRKLRQCGRRHGSDYATGKTFSRSNLSNRSICESPSPRVSTGIAPPPPTVAIGTPHRESVTPDQAALSAFGAVAYRPGLNIEAMAPMTIITAAATNTTTRPAWNG